MSPSARAIVGTRVPSAVRLLAGAVVMSLLVALPVRSQEIADPLVVRGLELEGKGRPREAAPLYRSALAGSDPVSALLGLERVFAELGMTDSLVAPLEVVVGRLPGDATVRAVQLRTLRALQRHDALHAAVQAWSRAVPSDAAPYREYARLLIADGRHTEADSVVTAASRALGDRAPMAGEVAQIRAAAGRWEESAAAFRAAIAVEPWLAQSASNALAPTPAERRAAVRAAFMQPPVDAAARLALAGLESRWGSSGEAWNALRDLPPDSLSAAAWVAFGEMAEIDGRWAQARTAFERALAWRESDALRVRAASAALASGDPSGTLTLLPWPPAVSDTNRVMTEILPLHVMALAQLRRPADAARLVEAWDRYLPPGTRLLLARTVAMGWVRQGELARARAALASDGVQADSSAAMGWIALFEGDAATARAMLGRGDERSADVALALGVLSRFRGASAPGAGGAFLSLAQGDTAAAAVRFEGAARETPAAASLLLLTAARLHLAAGDTSRAMAVWSDVAAAHPETAEAPEAMLHLARALMKRGDRTTAMQHLERLVLGYPASALVPVARRELEAARQAPGAGT